MGRVLPLVACLALFSSSCASNVEEVLDAYGKTYLRIKRSPDQKPPETANDEHFRPKRETTPASEPDKAGAKTPASFIYPLNDTHNALLLHWAGEGSPVIYCLATDAMSKNTSTSAIYISYEYGRSFENKTDFFAIQLPDGSKRQALVSAYYVHPVFSNVSVFTDLRDKFMFVTRDHGKTFAARWVNFTATTIIFDKFRPETIIAHDRVSNPKTLWLSEDYGESFRLVKDYVSNIYVDFVDNPITIYTVREEPSGLHTVFATTDYFENSLVVARRVKDFSIKDDLLLATRVEYKRNVTEIDGVKELEILSLWLARKDPRLNGKFGPLMKGKFPSDLPNPEHFLVADVSQGQALVVGMQDGKGDLYVSKVVGADASGEVEFSMSLPNIMLTADMSDYDGDSSTLPSWRNKNVVDFHKVKGLEGVYIANRIKPGVKLRNITHKFPASLSSYLSSLPFKIADIQSVITHDKGGEWTPLPAPKFDADGLPLHCSLEQNCSLHVGQPRSHILSTYLLSRESAVGLIMGTGVLGDSIKGGIRDGAGLGFVGPLNQMSKLSTYLSADGGVSWHQVLKGAYLYNIGDHGSVIVAVESHRSGETEKLYYSLDEGGTWESFQFYETPVNVYQLLIEPGENTTIFTMYASLKNAHEWLIIGVDFKEVFERNCTDEDYREWSPYDLRKSGRGCLMGEKTIYQRRIPRTKCYNGLNYTRPNRTEVCTCERSDYECDFGFKVHPGGAHGIQDPLWNAPCLEDGTDSSNRINIHAIPTHCPAGTFYNRSRGYRKIPGDSCVGGMDHLYEPERVPCPVGNEKEFILVARRHNISRLNIDLIPDMVMNYTQDNITYELNSAWETLPIEGLRNVIAVEFDHRNNCVYWGDINTDHVMRLCLDGESEPETLINRGLDSVEGLALDWISNNLYVVDGGTRGVPRIEVIRIDVNHAGRMRRTILDNRAVKKPRGIALHPHAGYMFWSDWSDSKPSVNRADLDGENRMVLFDSRIVEWPNGIAVDLVQNRIFFVDARREFLASANLDGSHYRVIVEGNARIPHPFGVGIFKGLVIWDDWRLGAVCMANKNTGKGIVPLTDWSGVFMDLKVIAASQTRQNVTNGCANATCQFLCVGKPGGGHSCLCPDGMKAIKGVNSTGETCVCPGGQTPLANGTCPSVNATCSSGLLACGNGLCIPMTWQCDGDNDCGDGSDEKDCGKMSCEEGQFTCNDGQCIPPGWQCDFDRDCRDGSDEENCEDRGECHQDEFKCANGRCLSMKWRCDMDDDCRDGSDEVNCTTHSIPGIPGSGFPTDGDDSNRGHGEAGGTGPCSPGELICGDGKCYPIMWKCDGDSDCLDGSDESNCTNHKCQSWQFSCREEVKCIYTSWVCDGEEDCANGSDESEDVCGKRVNGTTTVDEVPGMFPFDEDDAAGGNRSPGSGTDMSSVFPHGKKCTEWMFHCDNGNCIPFWWKCDSVDDCDDNSDEAMCGGVDGGAPGANGTTPGVGAEVRPPGEANKTTPSCGDLKFQCYSGRCIWASWVCDGDKDCEGGEDEAKCDGAGPGKPRQGECMSHQFSCEMSGGCIPSSLVCDGRTDCPDGSDEVGCIDVFPGHHNRKDHCDPLKEFTCNSSSMCIPRSSLCDKVFDCLDGSDEAHCDTFGPRVTTVQIDPKRVTESSAVLFWHATGLDLTKNSSSSIGKAEFLPAVRVKGLSRWINGTTWLNARSVEYKFDKLQPYTFYEFTVFSHQIVTDGNGASGDSAVIVGPPAPIATAQTKIGVPDRPENLRVRQVSRRQVQLTWDEPRRWNGPNKIYHIYMSVPAVNPMKFDVTNGKRTYFVSFDFMENVKYRFWVNANNGAKTSGRSAIESLEYSAGVTNEAIENARVVAKNDTWLGFAWNELRGSEPKNYSVQCMSENPYEQKHVVNTTATTAVVENLAPATNYSCFIYGMKNDFITPRAKVLDFTGGERLVPIRNLRVSWKNKGTTMKLTWEPPKDRRKIKWTYGVFFGASERELLDAGARHTTTGNSFTIANELNACEKYLFSVVVVGPLGAGPGPSSLRKGGVVGGTGGGAFAQASTLMDSLAPPKALRVDYYPTNESMVVISWNASCPEYPMKESYMVTAEEETTNHTWVFQTSPTDKGWMEEHYVIHPGGRYRINVRVNVEGSHPTPWVRFDAPAMPPPHQVQALQIEEGRIYNVTWQMHSLPNVDWESMSFVLWVSTETNWENAKQIEVKDYFKVLSELEPGKKYRAAVTLRDREGFHSKLSEIVMLEPLASRTHAPNTVDVPMSYLEHHSTVGVIVVVVIVLIILSAAIAVFALKNLKLRRSFMNFANSHYNSRSGAATISTSDGLATHVDEDDTPIIRGFSDDEPLVIS